MFKRPSRRYSPPTKDIRSGKYSDKYFIRSRDVLKKEGIHPEVVMQVFCKKDAVLCGIPEVVEILRLGGNPSNRFKVYALREGERIRPWETVMHIVGDYSAFVHLETVYLGIFSRRTSVATAVRRVVEICGKKPIFFFSARFDHYLNQPGDGYAAKIGGASGVSTEKNTAWLEKEEAFGTIPHGLIAAFEGDTVRAGLAFDRHIQRSVRRIALVDFDNDCVRTSLEVARALGKRLWGVRLDTARELHDLSVKKKGPESRGVCPELVRNVRRALDREGYSWVRIIVSGGFNAERIRELVRQQVPFDAVGIGSAFLQERIEFTADVVKVNGKPCAKVGRRYLANNRLRRVL